MTFYDLFLYIGLAVVIIYSIYYLAAYIRKRRKSAQKSTPRPKPISSKVAAISEAAGQKLRLNLMALEAVREMSAAAAKSSKYGKISTK